MNLDNTHPKDPVSAYKKHECAVFCRTREAHGGCSNMAGGYPIQVYERGTTNLLAEVRSSEALYQCGRFPHDTTIQEIILAQRFPMQSKMVMKPFVAQSRLDWNEVRVPWMDWVVRQKLASNRAFAEVLRGTDGKKIVELSRRDRFWGAVETPSGWVEGCNHLGEILTRLRDELPSLTPAKLRVPCPVAGMKLLGRDL